MRITLGMREVLVHVEHGSMNYKVINQYVQKNFSNTLKFSSAILIFNRDNESYKRQFFLQWLYASYKKTQPNLPSTFKANLLKRSHLPIKIRITDKKDVINKYIISLQRTDEHGLVMELDIKNYLLQNYLKLTFRKEIYKKSSEGRRLSLRLDSSGAKEKLAKLLKRKKLLNYAVAFDYDEVAMHDFLHVPKQRASHQVDIYRPHLVRRSYELLNSSPHDPIEEIKRRYITLVKKFHPDRIYHENRAKVLEYTEKFQRVQRAYEAVKKDKKTVVGLAG